MLIGAITGALAEKLAGGKKGTRPCEQVGVCLLETSWALD